MRLVVRVLGIPVLVVERTDDDDEPRRLHHTAGRVRPVARGPAVAALALTTGPD